MQRFGSETARCRVFTFKEGVLSRIAHDLKLEVTQFEIEVAASQVRAVFAADSLRVVNAMKDGVEAPTLLSPRDRLKIEQTIRDTVLQSTRFNAVQFRSDPLASATAPFEINGQLTLCGVTQRLTLRVEQRGELLCANTLLHQPKFGIAPYSAMMGSLRVKPDVRVEVALPAAAMSAWA